MPCACCLDAAKCRWQLIVCVLLETTHRTLWRTWRACSPTTRSRRTTSYAFVALCPNPVQFALLSSPTAWLLIPRYLRATPPSGLSDRSPLQNLIVELTDSFSNIKYKDDVDSKVKAALTRTCVSAFHFCPVF